MQGPQENPEPITAGATTSALEWAQRVLVGSPLAAAGLGLVLGDLARAFGVSGAGIASADGQTVLQHGPQRHAPMAGDNLLVARARLACSALVVPSSEGGSHLVTAFGQNGQSGGWILWLDDPLRSEWSADESAALTVAALALDRRLAAEGPRTRWAAQLERAARQSRLEAIAIVVRRLAHDYGNVLTGVLGFSELGLAQAPHPGSAVHGYLTEVHRGASSGAQFTHQLRLFARRCSLHPTPSSLVRILTEEVGRCGSHFEVRLDLPTEPPPVVLEADQLRQLLIVVLTNAREALSGAGRVEVSAQVRTLSTEDCLDFYGNLRPGEYVQLSVADNGPGLSAEAQRSLFVEPFFTTKPRRRGLGLMVSYGVLHAHGGGLAIESEPGRGTVVHLMLPVAQSAPQEPVNEEVAPEMRLGRILIVDEDAQVLRLLRTTLDEAGYRVTASRGVVEALTTFRGAAADPYRLVLADLNLPHGGGIGLARRLLKEDATAKILFLMSGPGTALPADLPCSAVGLLTKPFLPANLLGAVRGALAGVRQSADAVGMTTASTKRS